MSPDEIPQGDSFDFVLVPAREESDETEEAMDTGETSPEKKEESKGIVVYCMDISGSMSTSLRLPDLQGKGILVFYHPAKLNAVINQVKELGKESDMT